MSLRPYADTLLEERRGLALIVGPTGTFRIACSVGYETIAIFNHALGRELAESWARAFFLAMAGPIDAERDRYE